jgi:hypothetical protein
MKKLTLLLLLIPILSFGQDLFQLLMFDEDYLFSNCQSSALAS